MRSPFLGLEEADAAVTEGKDSQSITLIESKLQTMWLHLDHEIFRKQNWESLKHFRSKYDNEYA